MLQTAITTDTATPLGPDRSRDYELIRRAIAFLSETWTEQPSLDRLAAAPGAQPRALPEALQALVRAEPEGVRAGHHRRSCARPARAARPACSTTAYEVGLSGGSRLHDLFVSHEAMTPGDYKRRGEGLEMAYGFHASPFGEALLIATERGIAGLAFVDEDKGQTRQDALADMMQRWPKAALRRGAGEDGAARQGRFSMPTKWSRSSPVRLVMIGTDFDVRVWETLLKIPMGRAVSYTDIARHIGAPSASRAVGSAVGRNPISFVVPCHRVLRGDGSLGGYHWGLTRKRALIGWETGRVAGTG